MEVVASQVKAVYVAAARLKMERVVNYCAQYLVDHLDPATAIEIRSLPGIQRNSELAARVDAYLAAEVDCLHQGQLLSTPFRIVFFSFLFDCSTDRLRAWLPPRPCATCLWSRWRCWPLLARRWLYAMPM